MSQKKALVEVFGTYTLLQAFWIAMRYSDYDWDLVIRYVDGKKESLEQMKKDSEKTNLFSRVIVLNESNRQLSSKDKMKKTVKTMVSTVFFHKKSFFKKEIEKVVGKFDYELLCVSNSFSIFGCELLAFSKEIPTIILEDGAWEYCDFIVKPRMGKFTRIAGVFFFHIGIYNFIVRKNFKLNKYCTKYLSNPEKIVENNFKNVKKLFEKDDNYDRFIKICQKVYNIDNCDFDIVVFTSPENPYIAEESSEKQYLISWLERCYPHKKILLKKHPSDNFEYKSDICEFYDVYKTIPGEVLMPHILHSKIFFEAPSTIILSIDSESCDFKILKFPEKEFGADYTANLERLVTKLSISKDYIEEI